MVKISRALFVLFFVASCQDALKENNVIEKDEKPESMRKIKADLNSKGYQTFEFVDSESNDTILMQQYFMAFLNRGETRVENKDELDSLQRLHMAHLKRMYDEGYADISGPFGDDGHMRGITIYNVPTMEMADSLANLDPMVKAGHLTIEIKPWWAGKGLPLR